MNHKDSACIARTRCSARLSQRIDTSLTYCKPIPQISFDNISVVMPVRNNQQGVNLFLKALAATHAIEDRPREVIVVDNNSEVPIVISAEMLSLGLNVQLLQCKKTGPAAARNMGVRHATGDWILFSDSDCLPTPTTFQGYIQSSKRAIAFSGNVKATTNSVFTRFYDEQKVLIPHFKANALGENVPLYIVTANALVLREAIIECGLFDESFKYAAGEDVNLGVRLWCVGNIEYEFESTVLHDYESRILSFCKRFIRYGKGNWLLESAHGMNMRAKHSPPARRTITNHVLRYVQCCCLNIGYTIEKYCQAYNDTRIKQRLTITSTPTRD